MAARFVVVCGGYRTGSTLQYNLCGTYVEEIGVGRRLGLVDPDDVDAAIASYGDVDGFVGVAKSHHATGEYSSFRTPTRWVDLAIEGRAIPLMTTRDVADQRRSMSRKFGIPLEELDNSRVWLENRSNTSRWEELAPFHQSYDVLTTSPVEALKAMVDHIGIMWDADAAAVAARACSVDRMHASLPRISEGEYDPVTLVHWDHISSETLADLERWTRRSD